MVPIVRKINCFKPFFLNCRIYRNPDYIWPILEIKFILLSQSAVTMRPVKYPKLWLV